MGKTIFEKVPSSYEFGTFSLFRRRFCSEISAA